MSPERVANIPEDASRRYDWSLLLDGAAWKLTKGEDYSCKTASFYSVAVKAATTRGRRIRRRELSDGIIIQAWHPADPDWAAAARSMDRWSGVGDEGGK